MTEKASLRKKLKAARASIPEEAKHSYDDLIFQNVVKTDAYKNCRELLIYVSGGIEVGTHDIIRQAFLDGKLVLVPRCVSGTNIMEFFRICSFDDLEIGAYGILEPKQHCSEQTEFNDAICIVPALAFEKNGYRIGFGKGYYDRFLKGFSGPKLGICYEKFVIDDVYMEPHDIPVDLIVTEKKTLIIDKDERNDN